MLRTSFNLPSFGDINIITIDAEERISRKHLPELLRGQVWIEDTGTFYLNGSIYRLPLEMKPLIIALIEGKEFSRETADSCDNYLTSQHIHPPLNVFIN